MLLVPVHVHGSQVDVYVMINYIKLYKWKYESSVHCFEKKRLATWLKSVRSLHMLGSEVDAIMGVGACRRVGVYGRYCGCTSS